MKKFLPFLLIIIGLSIIPENRVIASAPGVAVFTNSGISFTRYGVPGDYEDYYVVDSIEKLYMMRYYITSGFILTRDLDFDDDASYETANSGFLQWNFNGNTSTTGTIKDELTSGSGWLPITVNSPGQFTNPISSINGNGHTISNLYANRNHDDVGLFGVLGRSGLSVTIENIIFSGVNLSSSRQYFGVIAGSTIGEINISNTYVNGSMNSSYDPGTCGGNSQVRMGGLIGQNSIVRSPDIIIIKDTGVNLNMSFRSCYIGGFVGFSRGTSISIDNSYFTGVFEDPTSDGISDRSVGGLIGVQDWDSGFERNIEINNSYTYSLFVNSKDDRYFGGLIGSANSRSENIYRINNVYTTGIYSAGMSGGFMGPDANYQYYFSLSNDSNLLNSYAAMVTSGVDTRKSFFARNSTNNLLEFDAASGYSSNPTIDNSFTFSDIPRLRGTSSFVPTEDILINSGILGETTSNNLFKLDWQSNVLGSGSQSWYFGDANGNDLPHLPLLLRSDINEPLKFQPLITQVPKSVADSGLLETFSRVNLSTFVYKYGIILNLDGGTGADSVFAVAGTPISISEPSKSGEVFVDWYLEPNYVTTYDIPASMPAQNLKLYARFEPAITYNLILNGGTGSITYDSYDTAPLAIPTPTRSGYTFAGWYEDAALTTPFTDTTMGSSPKTLYAKWTLTTFTITLDSVGGSAVGPVSGNEGDVIGLPEPTLRDYRFDGWLNSQGQLVSNPYTVKNVNETFSAKWTFVTFSPVTVIPLERTYYLDIDEPVDLEYGEELILPGFDAYEMYGRVKTDLSQYVTITGEIGDTPGQYLITYTLTYEDIVLTEEVLVSVVDTVPPTLTIEMPASVFYKNETTPVITAFDNAPGDVTVTAVKELDVMRPGVQLVIYDAMDASGNLTRVIQEVSVVMPEVRYEAVMVNAQRLMFVLYENLMDFTSMVLYMAQSIIEPPVTSNEWEVYEEREFIATGPGERVYLQMRDALGNILSRESIELFWREVEEFTPRRIRGEVVYPEVEPSYYIPWPLVGGISVGTISLSGLFFWFLKRRNKEKE